MHHLLGAQRRVLLLFFDGAYVVVWAEVLVVLIGKMLQSHFVVFVLICWWRLQLAVGFAKVAGTEIVFPRLCTLLSQQRRARAAPLRASLTLHVFLFVGVILVEHLEGRVLRDEEVAARAITSHVKLIPSLLALFFQIFLMTAAFIRFDQVLSRFENQSVLVRLAEGERAPANEAALDAFLD
jgi:hypothetical protein